VDPQHDPAATRPSSARLTAAATSSCKNGAVITVNGAIERQNEPLERLNGVLVEGGQDPMRGASVRRYRGGAVGQSKSSAETIEWSATGARRRGFCSAAAHPTDVQSGRLDLLAFIDEHDPMW
jgi:hypothetical protein